MRAGGLMVAAAFLTAGCQQASDGDNAVVAAQDARAAQRGGTLRLETDGLAYRYPDGRSGRAGFGAGRALSEQLAAAALGAPRGPASAAECAGEQVALLRFPGELTLIYRADRLAGWHLAAGEGPTLSTTSGIGIGTSRAELDAALDVTTEPTPGGERFAAGDLRGVLSAAGADGVVTELGAGVRCTADRKDMGE